MKSSDELPSKARTEVEADAPATSSSTGGVLLSERKPNAQTVEISNVYDPSRSMTSKTQMRYWLENAVPEDIRSVPGVGQTNAKHLGLVGPTGETISTTFQLLGVFMFSKAAGMSCYVHCNRFYQWLQSKGVTSRVNDIVQACAEKCNQLIPGIYDKRDMTRHRRFNRLYFWGPPPVEDLDRPENNFDVVGIPTGQWSSGLFECAQNIQPSCILSFFLPCMMWGQIVVRAQIPLFIGVKNGIFPKQTPRRSGFGFFVEFFGWSLLIAIILIIVVAAASLSNSVRSSFIAIFLLILCFLLLAVGHTRTAFKMKYLIPSELPHGWTFWDMILDQLVVTLCFPCALAQMARHVFQYDQISPPLGMFLGDPYVLPPLKDIENDGGDGSFTRPERADNAGLVWTEYGRHPDVTDQTGAAARTEMLAERERNGVYPTAQAKAVPVPSAPPATATVTATVVSTQPKGRAAYAAV